MQPTAALERALTNLEHLYALRTDGTVLRVIEETRELVLEALNFIESRRARARRLEQDLTATLTVN